MEQSDIYSCIQFVPDASKIQLRTTFNLLFAAVIRGTSRIEIYFRNLIPSEFSILYIFGRLTDHITINCVPFHSVPRKMTSSTLKSIDSIFWGGLVFSLEFFILIVITQDRQQWKSLLIIDERG